MGKILYCVHASVDGFIDGPNGEFDWARMGPGLAAYSGALNARIDTLLYGRCVWEMMVGYWPTAETLDDSSYTANFASFWRKTPKVVVSRSYPGDEWTTQVIGAEQVAALKARSERDAVLTGGVSLAASLTELGLIDEYHVVVHPVVLGGGRPLFAHPAQRRNLRLAASQVVDDGVVVNSYRLA